MGDSTSAKERSYFDDYDYKVDQSDDDHDDGSAGAYGEYHHNESEIQEVRWL